jgi:transcription antitermination factor NusG
MSVGKKNWYAVYTKSRCEKKVHSLFEESGWEAYCPLNRIKKKWSDRVKWVEEPLFKSYVFVKIAEDEKGRVREVSGVVNFLYWLGKPAIVKEKEINTIRMFLDEYAEVQAIPVDLRADARVTILKGALMNKEAKVVKVFNNKVQVIIESIGYSLVAIIDRSNAKMMAKNSFGS